MKTSALEKKICGKNVLSCLKKLAALTVHFFEVVFKFEYFVSEVVVFLPLYFLKDKYLAGSDFF